MYFENISIKTGTTYTCFKYTRTHARAHTHTTKNSKPVRRQSSSSDNEANFNYAFIAVSFDKYVVTGLLLAMVRLKMEPHSVGELKQLPALT